MHTPGYNVVDTLYTSAHTIVSRARREADGRTVILRAPRRPDSTADLAKLRHEYGMLLLLGWGHFLNAREPSRLHPGGVVASEDPGGAPLARIIPGEGMPQETALWIAERLMDRVGEMHQRRILHKDVNPYNVLVDVGARRVELLGFSTATRLPREAPNALSPERIEGLLPYVSPEQTGRMNRPIDHRTDYYSFGVTLYQMLTGRLPFRLSDPMEMVHAHLARTPTPPHELVPAVSRPVSDLVMRLLAKNPEERYQSARGVLADLRAALEQLATLGRVEHLNLGASDRPDLFQIPQRLYGREAEVAALVEAFERASAGRRELVLVAGYSGIGKSAIVREVHKPVVRRRGLYIEGKYEQLKADIPYFALTAAFRGLLRQLLGGSPESLARWRERLLEALGKDGGVLTDVIPELSLIIGGQPPAVELGPSEAQNRFSSLFERFVGVFAGPEHPLVVFLDDMQWADSASLKLVQRLTTGPEELHLLVVGAYRDNEVDAGHPLQLAMKEIERAGARMSSIAVGPLAGPDVVALVTDALRAARGEAEPLATVLLERTHGNPFFLIQFLHALHEEGLLRFDPQSGSFRCDVGEVRRQKGSTDNVIDLMVRRLRRLPERTRATLTLAACIGNLFHLSTLAVVTGRSRAEIAADLWEAVNEGQIVPLLDDLSPEARALLESGRAAAGPPSQERPPSTASQPHSKLGQGDPSQTLPFDADPAALEPIEISYRFLHDRVQQAAYTLISEEERRAVHLKAGRLLLARVSPAALEEQVFDIAGHLNLCLDLIDAPAERRQLTELNLLAGRRARASTAYGVALKHLAVADQLLTDGSWERDYELVYALHLLRAECEFLDANHDAAERLFVDLLGHARTALEKANICVLRTMLYRNAVRYGDAVQVILSGLRLLGVDLPSPDDAERLGAIAAAEAGELKALLAGRAIADLIDLPEVTDPETLVVMDLLEELSIDAIYVGPLLLQVAVFKLVVLSLRHGNARASCSAYAAYGSLLGVAMHDSRAGCAFGQLAMELSRRFGDPRAGCRSGVWYGACVGHFGEPLPVGIAVLREACDMGVRAGDPAYASYAAFFLAVHSMARGESMDEALTELAHYRRHMDAESRLSVLAHRQMALSLKGATRAPGDFDDGTIEEARFIADLRACSVLALQHYHVAKLQALALSGRHEEAMRVIDASIALGDIESILFGQLAPTIFAFYAALSTMIVAQGLSGPERAASEEAALRWLDKLRRWAEGCPANFQHQHLLLSAELARLQGREIDAIDLYEQAIVSASEHGFLQHLALAAERAAELHLDRGRRTLVRGYLVIAHDAYTRWGATAKARTLEERYPHLTAEHVDGGPSGAALDATTVMKAVQTISSEIVLERLLQRMMRIILENAGAERGHLLVHRESGLAEEAAGTAGGEHVTALRSIPVERCTDLPLSIVRYVERTGEILVLDDAANDPRFHADPTVARRRIKSILCAPVVKQRRRLAILYLENNLTTGAFTADRTRVLEVLSSQAAISLENAWLYDTLEQKVAQRTTELQSKNTELERAMSRLVETRNQLLMQEKLASLGALTAGIAHEIKNPLNFVNNFAELSVGLLDDLREQLTAVAGRDPAAAERVTDLLDDLQQIATKINQHGRRADAIVRAMLEHSRGGTGSREAIDINTLLAEYVALACHALRSRDGLEPVAVEASYDASTPRVVLVPQEIGRVFVNLLNNAWYATRAKQATAGSDFAPSIALSTKNLGDHVEIRVRDNGTGVPLAIRDSIFQPFFTTKPAGEGTGLGLSISHEIVQANGGTLRMESEEGQFAEFIVKLPLPGPSVG
ncbi:AAA family ATPase [Sorangium sp. So ce296]|uniref:trifunctional serine/threonine-protein kinase/ATP-binding protein/sensor histidine kinase n=1 Tax=Sorangium sp. So ce296 TaxID=3133296 RepID=UPI003F5EBA2A